MERRNDNGEIPKYSTVMAHLSGVVKAWNLLDIDVQMARLGVTTEEEKRSNDISIQESVDLAKPIVKKRCLENNKETKQHISITPEEVLEMMKLSKNNATKRECDNIRNCALIAACFIGAFRVHELVSIKLEDIQEASRKDGYNITVTQKGGSKVTKLIPRRKANGEESPYFNAIQRWLEYRNTIEGAFDNDYLFVAISRGNAIVSKNPMTIRAAQKNISPYFPADCSFHSFRVGFVTYAKSLGLTNRQIMQQSGHKSERMIDYYNRPHESEETNAVNQF
jgi:integrase